jgi:hypothetical protein
VPLVLVAGVVTAALWISPAGASVAASTSTIDFGEVPVGTTANQVVTITNTGATPFGPINMFGGAPPTPEFNASQNCQSQTLAPGGSCSITYTYSPTLAGTHADQSVFTISPTASQSDGQDFNISLRGIGVDPGATTTSPTTTSSSTTTATAGGSGVTTAPPPPGDEVSPSQGPVVVLGASTVAVGDEQTATVQGFQPGETVTATVRPDDLDLGAQVADAAGVVRYSWTIDEDQIRGLHELVATGDISGVASATFEVAPGAQAIAATDQDPADDSGARPWLVALLVAAVLALLVVVVLWVRSSRAPRPTPPTQPTG